MKSHIPLAASLVLAVAATGFALKWWQAEGRARSLATELAAARAESASALSGREELRAKAESFAEQINQLQAKLAAGAAPTASATTNLANAARSWLDRPDARARAREWALRGIDRNYESLFAELKLPPDQLEKLRNLLAESQGRAFDVARSMFRGDGTNGLGAAITAYQSQREQDQAAIRELLGDAKFGTYSAYERMRPAQDSLERIQRDLATSTSPLLPDQSDALLKVLAEESAANGFVSVGGGRGDRGPGRLINGLASVLTPGADPVTTLQSQVARQQESNARILQRAGTFLSAEQVDALRQQQQREMESLQRSIEWTQRTITGGSGTAQGPAPGAGL
jgi:hypothetical protein